MRRLVPIALLATTACSTFSEWFSDSVTNSDAGVPLTEFVAKDRDYFPPFITKFFPGVATFVSSFRTLAHARSDITLIEVKQLNDGPATHNEANLSWSADGVYLGFEVVSDGHRKIMLKDLVGNFTRDLHMMSRGPNNFLDGLVAKSTHSYNAGLRWSRDSTRFAFMSNGGVGEYNIYVGAVGVREKPITSSPTKDGYATWSPKTNEIAFVSSRKGSADVYLVDLKTRQVDRLSRSPAVDIFPEWFPSGDRVVYSSGDALDHDLHVVERKNRDGTWSKPWALTKWKRDDLRPTVSPDGQLIAFYADSEAVDANDPKTWNIHVIPFHRGKTYTDTDLKETIVAKDVVIDLNTGPAWSPDSRKLFYVKRDPGVSNPIAGYDLFTGKSYIFRTKTRMNRDIVMSKLGVLSFRAQVGVWDRVFVALTNQGLQLQDQNPRLHTKIHYLTM